MFLYVIHRGSFDEENYSPREEGAEGKKNKTQILKEIREKGRELQKLSKNN